MKCAALILVPFILSGATLAQNPVIQLSAGPDDTLAVRADGSIWAWGRDQYGEFGNGSWGQMAPTPSPEVLGGPWAAVDAAVGNHALGIHDDGSLWAWGQNSSGQLGLGWVSTRETQPVQVSTATGWISFSGGTSHSMAVKADGTIIGFGSNSVGELGRGTAGGSDPTPGPVVGLVGAVKIACGSNFTVAIDQWGFVWAWGAWSWDGQAHSSSFPVQVFPVSGVVDIACSKNWFIALKNTGELLWSLNLPHPSLPPLVSISAAGENPNTFAGIDTLGHVYIWPPPSSVAITTTTCGGWSWPRVELLSDAVEVTCGEEFWVARKSDDTVWSWGDNQLGQLALSSWPYLNDPMLIQEFLGPPLGVYLAAADSPCLGESLRLRAFSTMSTSPMFVLADSILGSTPIGDIGAPLAISQLEFSPNLVVLSDPTGLLGPTFSYPYTDFVGIWNLFAPIPNDPALSGMTLHVEAYLPDPLAANGVFHQSNVATVVIE